MCEVDDVRAHYGVVGPVGRLGWRGPLPGAGAGYPRGHPGPRLWATGLLSAMEAGADAGRPPAYVQLAVLEVAPHGLVEVWPVVRMHHQHRQPLGRRRPASQQGGRMPAPGTAVP